MVEIVFLPRATLSWTERLACVLFHWRCHRVRHIDVHAYRVRCLRYQVEWTEVAPR